MKPTNLILILFYMMITSSPTKAQFAEGGLVEKHTLGELKEDLGILRQSLEATHAGLYAYTSKEDMDSVFDELETSLNDAMTSIQFFREISVLHQHIKNAHTSFAPGGDYEAANEKELLYFPFDVYWDNQSLYIHKNGSSEDSIKEGSLIESINGELSSSVFNELKALMFRDGENTTGPELLVINKFSLYYSYFKGNASPFQMDIMSSEGVRSTIEVPALTLDAIKANKLYRYNKECKHWTETEEPVLLLEIKNGIAVMTIKTFSNYYIRHANQRFNRFLDQSFEAIGSENVRHLILDIRDNGGGNDGNIAALFSRVYDQPFTLYKNMSGNYKKIPNKRYYVEKSFLNLTLPLTLTKSGNGHVVNRLSNGGLLNPVKPKKNLYNGDIYVLTNGYSYSASGFMTSLFKNYKRGIIIGEEPGGNQNQCTAGIFKTLRLPNTGVEIRMPLVFIEMNVETGNTGHGVIPDFPIEPNIDDVLNERDVVMDFTLKLIKNTKEIPTSKTSLTH